MFYSYCAKVTQKNESAKKTSIYFLFLRNSHILEFVTTDRWVRKKCVNSQLIIINCLFWRRKMAIFAE